MVVLALYFALAQTPLVSVLIVIIGGIINRSRRSVLIALLAVGVVAIYQYAITGRLMPGGWL